MQFFSIQGVPTRLAQDVGRIPSDIVFSPTEDRLFIVDVGTSALIQLDIDPLSFIDTVQ